MSCLISHSSRYESLYANLLDIIVLQTARIGPVKQSTRLTISLEVSHSRNCDICQDDCFLDSGTDSVYCI